MKVRLIVRVPQRLLSGRLGAALDSSPDEEISTADTLSSLLAFDDPDYAETLNGGSTATLERELPDAPNEAPELPQATELAQLLDFDEIEAWSKSTSTLDEQIEPFIQESEPPAEAEDTEHELPSVETSFEAASAGLEEAVESAPETDEEVATEEAAAEDDASRAGVADVAEYSEEESAESSPWPSATAQTDLVEESEEAFTEEAADQADQPALTESIGPEPNLPESSPEAGELDAVAKSEAEPVDADDSPVPEPTVVAEASLDETLDRIEEEDTVQEDSEESIEPHAEPVQNLGERADVVRNALSSMPWWQRWEEPGESESGQASESIATPESEPAPEKINAEVAADVAADTEPDRIETEAAQIEQPLETEPQQEVGAVPPLETDAPVQDVPEFSPAPEVVEHAEKPVSRLQETQAEPITNPADFAPVDSARSYASPPEAGPTETTAPDAPFEEPYTLATEGTEELGRALDDEETGAGKATAEDGSTIYSWSAFERPEAKVMVPLSEQVVTRRRNRTIAAIVAAGVLFVGFGGWLYKTQTDPIRAMQALESGRRQLLVGSYGEAILDLNNAIAINPDNPEIIDAYVLRGRARVAMGRAEDALPDFTQAIQRDPDNVTAYLDRGLAYFNVGLVNQALNDGAKIIELDDQSADGYALRGMALRETGDLQAAMKDFNRAVELEPSLANLLQRGLLLQKLGRHEEAVKDFNEAIYLNPASPTAYFSRAQSLRELGQEAAADRDHRTARYLDGH